MILCQTIEHIRGEVAGFRRQLPGTTIGLVPTMGALHDGHLSLIDAARQARDLVVVSIFVNPTQFGPQEDYLSYPRVLDADLALCQSAGVHAVFHPTVGEMYPAEPLTSVVVHRLTNHLCGPHRPGHFQGVALVVTKLLHIIMPDRAYFGQKDVQQLAVVRRLVADLNLPIEIVGCPIIREPDGLALSSRNAYLTPPQRAQAASLHACLSAMKSAILTGQHDAAQIERQGRAVLEASGPCRIDYVQLVDPQTLQPVTRVDGPVLGALAVWIGTCRLIDAMLMDATHPAE